MILRSPSTILLLILAPMILMFLIGLAYNNVDNLSKTYVGYFGSDINTFENLGINFKDYNSDSLSDSEKNCKNDLKRGNLDLCLFIQVQEINGELKSAQLIYISDNTRSTMTNILISAFERELRKKTEEISSTTISSILGEVDSTLLFMEDTRELISDVDTSLGDLETQINENDLEIKKTISFLQITLPRASLTIKNLIQSLEEIDSINSFDLDDTRENLNYLGDTVEDIFESMEEIEDALEDEIGFIPSEVAKQLNQIESDLDQIKIIAETSEESLMDFNIALDKIDIENTIEILEELQTSFDDLIPVVNDLDIQYTQLKNAVDATKTQVEEVSAEVDSKYDYFNELSNQDSNQIIKPISSSTEPLFKQFSRVHELSPTIIVVVMLFIGLLLSNVIVSMEMNSKAYFRNIISPIPQTSFIIALFFTSLFIILLQLLFFFIILQFVFNVPVFGIIDLSTQMFSTILFLDTLVITLHLLLVFILLGMLFSLLFSSIQISVLVTTFAMLFFFLLSDIILPLQLMPDFFYTVISYNPIVIGQDLFRQLFFFSETYFYDVNKFLPFYVYTLILVILISFAKNSKKKQLLN
jgi:hypothetical protein